MSEQSARTTSHQLTLFAEDFRVRISPSQAVVRAWLDHGPGFGGNSTVSWLSFAPLGSWSRTSLASCHRTGDGTWAPSSRHWGTWGTGGPTECWTLNGSECPSAAAVCSLSDILETTAPPRYSLSPKAAAG